jgi:hypothetical protein
VSFLWKALHRHRGDEPTAQKPSGRSAPACAGSVNGTGADDAPAGAVGTETPGRAQPQALAPLARVARRCFLEIRLGLAIAFAPPSRRRGRRERGFVLDPIFIGVGAIIVSAVVFVFTQGIHAYADTTIAAADDNTKNALVRLMTNDARNAMAVCIPATDVNGGVNNPVHEVAFYTRDSNHNPYFWSYYSDGAGNVTREFYDDPLTHANLRSGGSTFTNITNVVFTPQLASTNDLPIYAAHTPADSPAIGLGRPGSCQATNQRVDVSFTTANDPNVAISLLPEVGTSGDGTITVGNYYQPGPLVVTPGSVVFLNVGQNTCVYPDNSVHSPCLFDVSEKYYTGQFTVNASACNNVATVGAATLAATSDTPVGDGLAPVNPSAGCTIQVTDDHGGSGSVSVTLVGPLTDAPNPVQLTASGPAGGFTTNEVYYTNGPIALNLASAYNGQSGCSGLVTMNATTGNLDPSFNLSWSVAPTTYVGLCYIEVTDNHGGTDWVEVNVAAAPPPTPAPTCPPNTTGTPPSCIPDGLPSPAPTCPPGDTGTPPDCVVPPQLPGYEYFVYSQSAGSPAGLFGTFGYLYYNGVLIKTNAIDGKYALCEGPLESDMDFPPTVNLILSSPASLTGLPVTAPEVSTLYQSEGVPSALADTVATCSLTAINGLIPVGLEELVPGTGPFLNTDVYQLTTYDIGTLP